MSKQYFLDKNKNEYGFYELHSVGCPRPPEEENRLNLGEFFTCKKAMEKALEHFMEEELNGCYLCCTKCHKN